VNGTVPEEVGKVAGSVVDKLGSNPSCLAALAVVALFGVLNYFESERQNTRMMARTQEVGALLKECLDSIPDRQSTRSIPAPFLTHIPDSPKPEDLP
jgi:hypothetical protein